MKIIPKLFKYHAIKLAQQQKLLMSILTVLLGSQKTFTIKNRGISFFNIAPNKPIAELIEVGLWIIMGLGVLAVAVVVGANWLRKRFKIGKKDSKASLTTPNQPSS